MRTFSGFLRRDKLRTRLEQLKTIANEHHDKATEHWRGWLDHVRRAGEALQEAYERLGRRKKWSHWRKVSFQGSRRQASDYRIIFRKWDDPRLVEARKEGNLNSIRGVLDILRGKSLSNANSTAESWARRDVRRQFASKLKSLSEQEIDTLHSCFDQAWDSLYSDVQEIVCAVNDDSYYYMTESERREAEEQTRIARTAIDRAANSGF